MNIVASVFGTMKEMYRGLNPATLTGAIDVIVVEQPDGTFHCSPFHVRFGKLGVLRSKEKVVDIEINGEPVDLHMKLGDNGEAFFVEETEDLESEVPAHLCTSPLPRDPEEPPESAEGATANGTRRKKRRKKRVRSDCLVREESSSEERDEREEREEDTGEEREESNSPPHHTPGPTLQNSKSIYYSMCEEVEQRDAHSDSEQSPNDVFFSRPSSPKSDSELCVRPRGTSGPEIQWNWGGFPTPCQAQRSPLHVPPSSSHFRTIERQDSFDLGISPPNLTSVTPKRLTVVRPKARTRSLDLNNYFCQPDSSSDRRQPQTDISHLNSRFCRFSLTKTDRTETDTVDSAQDGETSARVNGGEERETERTSDDKLETEETTNEPAANGQEDKSVEDRREKRSLHVGTSDIYLDDLTSMDPEVALLYFPKTEKEPSQTLGSSSLTSSLPSSLTPQTLGSSSLTSSLPSSLTPQPLGASSLPSSLTSQPLGASSLPSSLTPQPGASSLPSSLTPQPGASSLSGSLSPQSEGSGAMDSGTDYLSDSASFSPDVSVSLCGPGASSVISKDRFEERMVSYQDLTKNPGLIDDPNLVICIDSNYYNWAVAGPMVLAMAAFQKNLPKSTVERLVKEKMSKRSGRWWFPFRRRDLSHNQKNPKDSDERVSALPPSVQATLDDVDSDEAAGLGRFASLPASHSSETLSSSQSFSHMCRKSLRLTSKQIEQLNLCEGENSAVFSVTTQYQGTCRCEASIFLWSWNDRVVISDIDGTITKSDALGHFLTSIGADWTQSGIAKLYQRIHQNGYRLLYCSARAIGMSAWTKEYLNRVNDRGAALPKGPVLLAPSSLVSALHREVIEKTPEVFKVACLSDIRDLFNPHREPFYAAFGNRTNDVTAYRAVGVPETRIFTVNHRGELIQEKTKSNKSSYLHLCELVEHFFPSLCSGSEVLDCPDFSSATFWKEPLPPLDLDALL